MSMTVDPGRTHRDWDCRSAHPGGLSRSAMSLLLGLRHLGQDEAGGAGLTVKGATTMTTILTTATTTRTGTTASLWRAGLTAAAIAAVATTTVAAAAHGAGVSFETAPGDAIPMAGFAQLTILFSVIGIGIAAVLRRRSAQPRTTFVRVAVALTVLSVVPDLAMSFDAGSRVSLMLAHAVAALIVIPVVARQLPPQRR